MTPKKPDPIGSKSVIQVNRKLNQELKIKTKIENQIKKIEPIHRKDNLIRS